MIKSFDELEKLTREKISQNSIPKMGVVFPKGDKSVQAAAQAHKDGYVNACLIGHKRELEKKISDADLDYENFERIDADTFEEAAKIGVDKVKSGELDFLLKSSSSTKELVDVLMKSEIGFAAKGQTVSHVGLIQTEKYHKLMMVTDAAVNVDSNAKTKIKITQNAAKLAGILGIDQPKAALLAAVEAIYPAVPETMEEAAIAKMSDRGQIKGVDIDGPLSFDVAINTEVAHSKGITNSKVAGDTDIFVAPSIATANGMYKAMVMYGKAQSAGVIFGGNATIASSFTVDSIPNIINSIILGSYIAFFR